MPLDCCSKCAGYSKPYPVCYDVKCACHERTDNPSYSEDRIGACRKCGDNLTADHACTLPPSEPTRFRKKPIVITAIQWTGENYAAVYDFLGGVERVTGSMGDLVIHTLEDGQRGEAIHVASPGDWIIKGVKGEFYPIKPDILEATYERED